MRFETLAVHAGGEADRETGAVTPPIHLSTTFLHGPESEPLHGRLYQREGNPTQDRLEAALAALDGGAAALAFASGMAAASTLLQSLPPGARVLFHRDIYSGVRQLALDFLPRWGMEPLFADLADPEAVAGALSPGGPATPSPALVWAETPTNPQLEILDLTRLAAAAHAGGASLLVDGTFATPALQRPLTLGADLVLHSTTKYLGGHSDVLGGALIFAQAGELLERVGKARRRLGGTASPFNSWLVLRGLRSLSCRMERHSSNALALASALSGHPALIQVLYPGLSSHPGHVVASRQMGAFGGMLALRVAGGRAAAVAVASRLRLFLNATSLGGPESLVEHRASSDGPGTTTPEDLLRLSIGLEHPDDLLADLLQALDSTAPG
jgi:cystathionine gamma-synthase